MSFRELNAFYSIILLLWNDALGPLWAVIDLAIYFGKMLEILKGARGAGRVSQNAREVAEAFRLIFLIHECVDRFDEEADFLHPDFLYSPFRVEHFINLPDLFLGDSILIDSCYSNSFLSSF